MFGRIGRILLTNAIHLQEERGRLQLHRVCGVGAARAGRVRDRRIERGPEVIGANRVGKVRPAVEIILPVEGCRELQLAGERPAARIALKQHGELWAHHIVVGVRLPSAGLQRSRGSDTRQGVIAADPDDIPGGCLPNRGLTVATGGRAAKARVTTTATTTPGASRLDVDAAPLTTSRGPRTLVECILIAFVLDGEALGKLHVPRAEPEADGVSTSTTAEFSSNDEGGRPS